MRIRLKVDKDEYGAKEGAVIDLPDGVADNLVRTGEAEDVGGGPGTDIVRPGPATSGDASQNNPATNPNLKYARPDEIPRISAQRDASEAAKGQPRDASAANDRINALEAENAKLRQQLGHQPRDHRSDALDGRDETVPAGNRLPDAPSAGSHGLIDKDHQMIGRGATETALESKAAARKEAAKK